MGVEMWGILVDNLVFFVFAEANNFFFFFFLNRRIISFFIYSRGLHISPQRTLTQCFVTAQPIPAPYFVTGQPTPTQYFVTAQPTSTRYFVTAQDKDFAIHRQGFDK